MKNMSESWLIREKFKHGEPLTEAEIRPEILASWRRAQALGLEFDYQHHIDPPNKTLQQRIADRKALYAIAVSFMQTLHDVTKGSGFISSFTDEEGYVLAVVGESELIRDIEKDKGFNVGCCRAEHVIGTNAIGLALHLKKPVHVRAWEHYYRLAPQWMCSAAPVYDSEQKVVGVFCLTGLNENVSFHTLGMVAASAAAISWHMSIQEVTLRNEREQKRMKIILENMPSGILLANSRLEVTQSNTQAARLLMRSESEIMGKKLTEIFDPHFFTTENLQKKIEEKNISCEFGLRKLNFSINIQASPANDYIISFDKTESLHKKINRIIGLEARFKFEDIIGSSPNICNTMSLARIAASNTSVVLITGESGTGKELLAQAIHNASSRKHGPFVAVNCGGIPKSLIESELFGYEGGAFTGAQRNGYIGKFELANGGTLFLDEIGDMPFEVQTSLLRVLQNRQINRIGSNHMIQIDVRIISATNKNLSTAVLEGSFRNDLYYRLNVFNIHIPPLRERTGDIRQLAVYFLGKYAKLAHKAITGFSEDAFRLLEACPWNGNVRELENSVERAVYLAETEIVGVECLGHQAAGAADLAGAEPARPDRPALSFSPAAQSAVFPQAKTGPKPSCQRARTPDRKELEQALLATRGNIRQAAQTVGVSRCTFYRKMLQYGIDYRQMRES